VATSTIQVAWLSRLASKGIIAPGQSIVEFSPQDVLAPREVVRRYALRHNDAATVDRLLDEIYDGEKPRADGIPAFYCLFGLQRYRCLDLLDARADWLADFNSPVKLGEQFDVVTNFGTAEHVFSVGSLFRSIHDALKPGGVALHVLPTFGDINHGFYNIHPTVYFDLAAANDYVIEDLCYVDRWDVRNKILEADPTLEPDFDNLPIAIAQMKDRAILQRLVTERFIANYNDPDTQRYGRSYPSVLYDYCVAALRKQHSRKFRVPMQDYYAHGDANLTLTWNTAAAQSFNESSRGRHRGKLLARSVYRRLRRLLRKGR